jgi:hypothetical protein
MKEVVQFTNAYRHISEKLSMMKGKVGTEVSPDLIQSVSFDFDKYLKREQSSRFRDLVEEKMQTVEIGKSFYGHSRYETSVFILSPQEMQDILFEFGDDLLREFNWRLIVDEKRGTQEGI